jgi:hypothetical protein
MCIFKVRAVHQSKMVHINFKLKYLLLVLTDFVEENSHFLKSVSFILYGSIFNHKLK